MISEDACLTQVQGIVAGKTPNLWDLLVSRSGHNLVNFAPELDSGTFWTGTDLLRMSLMVGAWGGCQKIHKALQGIIYGCQV